MSTLHRLRPADYREMPWKNGRGSTLELAAFPPSNRKTPDEFEWRVSIAAVNEDGPFSSFPGYDRVILVLEGDGMRLSHGPGQAEARLGALEPYAFSGDAATTCALTGGPVRDFNLMTRRDRRGGAVRVLRPQAGLEIAVPPGVLQLLYCHRGPCRVRAGQRELELEPEESLIVDPDGEATELTIGGAPDSLLIQVQIRAL